MRLKYILLGFLGLTLASCSSDEDNVNDVNSGNYFPLANNYVWEYENKDTNENAGLTENKIIEELTANALGDNRFSFTSSLEGDINQGVATGILSRGTLTKSNGQLIYNGNFSFNPDGLDAGTDLNIPIENLIIYDKNKTTGGVLSSLKQQLDQTIVIEGSSVPVTIDVELKTIQNAFIDQFNAGGITYEDILKTTLVLDLKIDANLFIPVNILPQQEVFTQVNFFAEDIGLIFSESDLNYNFSDALGQIAPNFPTSGSQSSSQTIVNYYFK